ncbi:hypothetical protein JW826_05675 [Candidatus Woesearchaeota archaeon]|nr:hypothetical protein [Candidatus Woesearchaeota archaeon]
MSRAQVALEFVGIVMMLIVLIASMAWTAYALFASYSEERNLKNLQDLGYSLQNEIILASHFETGYLRNITVPEQINGVDVNISGDENEIFITYKNNDLVFTIPEVTGAFQTGPNMISKLEDGSIQIS